MDWVGEDLWNMFQNQPKWVQNGFYVVGGSGIQDKVKSVPKQATQRIMGIWWIEWCGWECDCGVKIAEGVFL